MHPDGFPREILIATHLQGPIALCNHLIVPYCLHDGPPPRLAKLASRSVWMGPSGSQAGLTPISAVSGALAVWRHHDFHGVVGLSELKRFLSALERHAMADDAFEGQPLEVGGHQPHR